VKPHALFVTLLIAIAACTGTVASSGSASSSDTRFTVSSRVGGSSLSNGQTLSGPVVWTATPSGGVTKVDFLIDGAVKWTEHSAPYQFDGDPGGKLDTTALTDAKHTLKVRAYRSGGGTTSTSTRVVVANKKKDPPPPPPPPPPHTPAFAVTSSVASGAVLEGSVTWTATPSGATVGQVDFLVDGAVRWTERATPYQFNGDPDGTLDTTTLSAGPHTLAVEAYASDGRTAAVTSSVTVENAPSAAAPFAVTESVANGASLSGSVVWTASPSGQTTSKVEFLVDGTVESTDTSAPYRFDGDAGQLDTTTLANGPRTLAVQAYGADGRTATASATVTVSNAAAAAPPPPPAPALGSIPRFGIATGYKILTRNAADQKFELDQIQQVGAKLVRFDSTTANQAQVDTVVNGVLARGLEPILILFGTTGPINPTTAAAFAASQATKWKGRVHLYEFTNEPDLHGWTGTTYTKALIPVYNAIKAADPKAIVIAGALWTGAGGPTKFVTDMYNAGAKNHFDILSLHLYDDPYATGTWNIWNMTFHTTPSVRSIMDAHGDQNIPIGATEAGGPTNKYGETGQATIINHDFDALQNDPRLAFICIYSMMDDEVPGFGLLNPNRTKRQAWNVYASRATSSSSTARARS
jgi:hypothetical protein